MERFNDMMLSDKFVSPEEYKRLKKMLIVGIVFAFITMVGGEMPIGWTVYPDAENELISMMMGCGSLSLAQLASGVLFGGIGIPVQYYGYKAIGEIISKGGCKKCGKLIDIGAKAVAFFGSPVHLLCIALMFLCRTQEAQTATNIPQNIMDFTIWLVLPLTVVFMAFYIPMTIAMIIPVVKGKTIFPKWAVIFNPILYKILLNMLAEVAPNTALFNGIRMSNMGLGSFITFLGLLILLYRNYSKGHNSEN